MFAWAYVIAVVPWLSRADPGILKGGGGGGGGARKGVRGLCPLEKILSIGFDTFFHTFER